MLKKMPGLDKSKEESRSITTIQVGLSQMPKMLYNNNLGCFESAAKNSK